MDDLYALTHEYKQQFSVKDVQSMLLEGKAVDATNGGLIIGRSHSEGGIYFLLRQHEEYYCLEGELEGYEFILNTAANMHFSEYVGDVINKREKHLGDFKGPYAPPSHIRTIETVGDLQPNYMVFEIGNFAIINKQSTVGYLESLNHMNNSITLEKESIFKYYAKHNSRDEINLMHFNKTVRIISAR